MNKFKEQLKIIEEALLKPMSDDRAHELDAERLKIRLDEIKKHMTLNNDGSYDIKHRIDYFINIANMNLTKLPMKFNNVGMDFDCGDNKLTTLEGAPKYVNGSFWCNNNKLTSLEGAPREVTRDFLCFGNTVQFTEEDVRAVCNVKGRIFHV